MERIAVISGLDQPGWASRSPCTGQGWAGPGRLPGAEQEVLVLSRLISADIVHLGLCLPLGSLQGEVIRDTARFGG